MWPVCGVCSLKPKQFTAYSMLQDGCVPLRWSAQLAYIFVVARHVAQAFAGVPVLGYNTFFLYDRPLIHCSRAARMAQRLVSALAVDASVFGTEAVFDCSLKKPCLHLKLQLLWPRPAGGARQANEGDFVACVTKRQDYPICFIPEGYFPRQIGPPDCEDCCSAPNHRWKLRLDDWLPQISGAAGTC